MERYELEPRHDSRKSFYQKAFVRIDGNTRTLESYDTDVCRATKNDGSLTVCRLWNAWSATTGRHVHEFLLQLGYCSNGKRFWDSLPIDEPVTVECNFYSH